MRLGNRILRNMFRKPARHRRGSLVENAVNVAVGVATVAAINKLSQEAGPIIPQIINHAVDLKNAEASGGAKTQTASTTGMNLATEKRLNTLLAKLALSYYIAGIDGTLSEGEKKELNEIVNLIESDSSIPAEYKTGVREVSDPDISFVKVQQYLDKAESSALISFAYEIEDLAKVEGLTPKEEDAVEMYKYYVTEKTGHKFIKTKEDPVEIPVEIDLTCPKCGGQMDLDRTMLKATCIYCGASKIVDANQIKDVVSQIERSKRLGL